MSETKITVIYDTRPIPRPSKPHSVPNNSRLPVGSPDIYGSRHRRYGQEKTAVPRPHTA
jgi:hypothetical protein